jgi:hypothetical protein
VRPASSADLKEVSFDPIRNFNSTVPSTRAFLQALGIMRIHEMLIDGADSVPGRRDAVCWRCVSLDCGTVLPSDEDDDDDDDDDILDGIAGSKFLDFREFAGTESAVCHICRLLVKLIEMRGPFAEAFQEEVLRYRMLCRDASWSSQSQIPRIFGNPRSDGFEQQ